jgi:hypothetical protein
MSAAQHTPGSEGMDVRYFSGPYADQIAVQLWIEMRHGCAQWWDRPLCPVYEPRKRKPSTRVAVRCGRCDGAGAIASFSVRYSGVCFACGGSGFRLISRAAYNRRAAIAKATGEQA